MSYGVPNRREQEILTSNGMNPREYVVVNAGEDWLHVRCYKTRDDITIHQGEKKWPEEERQV